MQTSIDIRDLPSRMDEAMSLVSEGNEVIVTDGNVPRARIVPCSPPRVLGLHPGAFTTSPDFDAPLPDAFWTGE